MQSNPKKEDKIISIDNTSYKKIFYIGQCSKPFFEKYIPEFKLYYGFGKIKLKENEEDFSFKDFSEKALLNL